MELRNGGPDAERMRGNSEGEAVPAESRAAGEAGRAHLRTLEMTGRETLEEEKCQCQRPLAWHRLNSEVGHVGFQTKKKEEQKEARA